MTPVDDQHSDIFHNIWLNRVDDSPFVPDSQERRMKLAKAQFLADLEIWKHIRYTDPPGLAAGEVPRLQLPASVGQAVLSRYSRVPGVRQDSRRLIR